MRSFCCKILIAAVLFGSCSNNNQLKNLLTQVDSYIEQYPDSALTVLESIETKSIKSAEMRAKHALLYSMAIDKNYIDKTDFSVLQPAIDYYKSHGNATDKLRTLYYTGCIFRNIGDDESAMLCYVKGLSEGENSDDFLTKARLLFSKAKIHNKLYEMDKYTREMVLAADFFKRGNKPNSYFNALCSACNGYILINDTLNASNTAKTLENIVDSTNKKQLSELYEAKISLFGEFFSDSLTVNTINEYLKTVPKKNIKWLTLANTYNKQGLHTKSLDALEMYNKYNPNKNSRYYAIASRTHELLGNSDKALESYKRYIHISDSLDLILLNNDTKFIEERYNLQISNIEKSKQNQRAVFISIIAILTLVSSLLYIRLKLKTKTLENHNYRLLCQNLVEEKISLQEALKESEIAKGPVKEIIAQRLSLLNTIVAATISANYKIDKKATEALNKLISNKQDFLKSTVSAFEISHPKFIVFLKEKSLTDTEIKHCCLYALGLNGKEVGQYTQESRYYITSHNIRKKLGLQDQDPNLSKFISTILQENSGVN